MVRIWLLAGALVALAGCTIQPVQPDTPVTQSQPSAPAADATLTPAENAAARVIEALAEETQLASDQMTVVSVEEVEWPDACLGVNKPDEMCAAVITPGFRVVIDTPNGQYEVHTDAEARFLRIASAP